MRTAQQIARRSNLRTSMASWSPASVTVTGDPLKQHCAAEAAAHCDCHLEKPVIAWPARVEDEARWIGMKEKQEGEQWEKDLIFVLCAGKIKPHCTVAVFWSTFCLRTWLSLCQFKSLSLIHSDANKHQPFASLLIQANIYVGCLLFSAVVNQQY